MMNYFKSIYQNHNIVNENTKIFDKYVNYLNYCIEKSLEKHGQFATSGSVNTDLLYISTELYNKVANHFRSLGHIVHSPPTIQQWQTALLDKERSNLSMLQWTPIEKLERFILIEIKTSP